MMISPGIEADASLRLCASLDANTAMLRATENRRRQMALDVSYVPDPITIQFAGSALTAGKLWKDFQPRTGWNWAVQHVAVAGLGTSDYLNLCRGFSTADAQTQKGLHSFTVSTAGTIADWHPGRTGLVLLGRDMASLVFTGSSSATALSVTADVIQVSDEQLPYFLL